MSLKVSEREFQSQVISYAQLNGWLCHAEDTSWMKSGRWGTAIRGDAGWPDVAFCRGDQFLLAELKSARGQPTVGQLRWHKALVDAGVDVHIWRTSDWKEIEQTLGRRVAA